MRPGATLAYRNQILRRWPRVVESADTFHCAGCTAGLLRDFRKTASQRAAKDVPHHFSSIYIVEKWSTPRGGRSAPLSNGRIGQCAPGFWRRGESAAKSTAA
jgi:hypothetical protein